MRRNFLGHQITSSRGFTSAFLRRNLLSKPPCHSTNIFLSKRSAWVRVRVRISLVGFSIWFSEQVCGFFNDFANEDNQAYLAYAERWRKEIDAVLGN